MILTCPECEHEHDVSGRFLGDVLWCTCGAFLRIISLINGGWIFQIIGNSPE